MEEQYVKIHKHVGLVRAMNSVLAQWGLLLARFVLPDQ